MYAGRIVETAPTREIFANPRHPYTKGCSVSAAHRGPLDDLVSIEGPPRPRRATTCSVRTAMPDGIEACREYPDERSVIAGHRVSCWRALETGTAIRPADGVCAFRMMTATSELTGDERERSATPLQDVLIEVRQLQKHFPIRTGVFGSTKTAIKAVDGIDFTVRNGETFGLVGESGCGKSTTSRLLLRLETPTTGTVRFNGKDIQGLSDRDLQATGAPSRRFQDRPFAQSAHGACRVVGEP